MGNIKKTPLKIKIYSLLIGILVFLALTFCIREADLGIIKEGKMRATFTAETTINRIQSQISRYLEISEFFRNMIQEGHELDDEEFTFLSEMVSDDAGIIKAIELAPGGIVKNIYPLKGNEAAFGIDMLKNPARKYEANLAMKSGEYTIAGPYELNQGGIGSLLFEPIYTSDSSGKSSFWGFSILVLDWEKFIKELELNKLEEASYCFQIWKKDGNSGGKTVIAEGNDYGHRETLQVKCKVPNDTWYFEIMPHAGWITAEQMVMELFLAVGGSVLGFVLCYLILYRKYKEELYTAEITRSAEEARSANEAKTRFLFNMSHDIRTPMNAIVGFSGLLEKNIQDEEKALDYIKKIRASSDILLTLINQVLEMARIESGKTSLNQEAVSIHEMMNTLNMVFESSFAKKSLSHEYHIDLEHDHILCDKTKVEEIILNIVGNSVKYTESHGKITITVAELASTEKNRANYELVVEDTGIGMSEEYLPHIFEEFSREHTSTETKVEGTGLGLPIVKSLVDLMGGDIQVESKVGEGTRFILHFTFAIATEAEISRKEKQDVSDIVKKLKGKRLLLAEDNDLNAEIAETVLNDAGLEVIRVEDGIMCVSELQKRPTQYFDAILMDIQMPNMDGYTATKVIRNLGSPNSRIPIIAMTANAYDGDRRKAREAGMNGFLAKPLQVDEIIRQLGKSLKISTNKEDVQ